MVDFVRELGPVPIRDKLESAEAVIEQLRDQLRVERDQLQVTCNLLGTARRRVWELEDGMGD